MNNFTKTYNLIAVNTKKKILSRLVVLKIIDQI